MNKIKSTITTMDNTEGIVTQLDSQKKTATDFQTFFINKEQKWVDDLSEKLNVFGYFQQGFYLFFGLLAFLFLILLIFACVYNPEPGSKIFCPVHVLWIVFGLISIALLERALYTLPISTIAMDSCSGLTSLMSNEVAFFKVAKLTDQNQEAIMRICQFRDGNFGKLLPTDLWAALTKVDIFSAGLQEIGSQ